MQEKNNQNSQNTENTMFLEEEWTEEDQEEPKQEEITKIEIPKIEIPKEEIKHIIESVTVKKTEENNDKNLYYSRENPGYTIVKLPGLYPYKVSKPMKHTGLRRMTTTWSIDDNDMVIDYDYFDDVKEHSISVLQSLISTKNLENEIETTIQYPTKRRHLYYI